MGTKIPEDMKSVTVYDNYRVVVEVTAGATYGTPEQNHQRRRNELNDVAKGIERHVNDIAGAHAAWDTKITCPHCGYWEDDRFQDGEPQCCTMAQDEFEALGYKLSEA